MTGRKPRVERRTALLRRLLISVFAVALALVPAAAFAAGDGVRAGIAISVNGTLHVLPGETVRSAIVLRGDAVVEGEVRNTLLVIDGNAFISGKVDGDITVIRGDVTLRPGSRVNNVTLLRGTVHRGPGAIIDGSIRHRASLRFGFASGAFWIFVWLSITVAVMVAGLVFAAVGGRQLTGAASLLTKDAGYSVLATIILWIGLPIIAVLAFVTIVGAPLGLGLFLMLLPSLWFLGYIVAGTALGKLMVSSHGSDHPYLPAFLGLLVLQIAALIPAVGFLVAGLAGLYGGGALALTSFRAARGGRASPPARMPPAASAAP